MTNTTHSTCYADDHFDSVSDATAHTMQIVKGLLNRVTVLTNWLSRAYAVSSQRRAMKDMSNAQLNDIGLSREAVEREAARPFWDLP